MLGVTWPADFPALVQTELRALTFPVTRLLTFDDPLGIPWLMAGIAFVLMAVALSRLRHGQFPRSLILWRRFLFPRRVLWNPSSHLDYKLFLVNSILVTGGVSLILVGPDWWRSQVRVGLVAVLGNPPSPLPHPEGWVIALSGLLSLLALDFGYWVAHLAMHRVPELWEFHKVHHSAEVMTPATEWRQHPVEFFVFPMVYGMTTGLVYGVIGYIFGATAQGLGLNMQNLLVVAHLATFHHVRHSHIRIAFTGVWGRLLHSPAHHQLHHSSDPAHYDCNLGYLLSVWDAMAGTLILPTGRERLTLGIGPEGRLHDSVVAVYRRPFAAIWKMWRPRFSRRHIPGI